jgi:trans-aconitate 2-methyltransferase
VRETGFYYDLLAPLATKIDIWETTYQHVLSGVDEIIEWYKGTGLRPFLEALKSEEDRTLFLSEYRSYLFRAYPTRTDGRVLFPFRRLFVIAYRN